MNGHDPATGNSAGVQYVIEDRLLRLPMLLKLRPPIEADFTNVHGLIQLQVKERQFTDSLMRNLGMQAQCRPYTRA
jgi:hypothetical protein